MDMQQDVVFAGSKSSENLKRPRPEFTNLISCIGQDDETASITKIAFRSEFVLHWPEDAQIDPNWNAKGGSSAHSNDLLAVLAHDYGGVRFPQTRHHV